MNERDFQDADRRETKPGEPGSEGTTREDRTVHLARILEVYLAELEAGRNPDRARLLAEHPDLADSLAEALAGLEFIHRAGVSERSLPAQLGDFRVIREVGRGGMGVVYEAEQISLRRRVALKVLRHGPVADEVAMQRFQREAETVGRLHHTNIVPIYAIGAEEGVRYYAMQFIEGRDLGRIAEGAREEGHPLDLRQVAEWGLQAAEALAHAHQRGVIHRDIKPSNLILGDDGRIWLTDFGLARRLDDVTLSLTGALLGTPRYMSPEQAAAARQPVDHRTDLYSLGATLYELATGRPIFEATSAHEIIAQILHREPIAPRRLAARIPRDLETIILECLAKEPDHRYASAAALAEDLRALVAGRPIRARRPALVERAVRWVRQHRRIATVAAGSALASALLLGVGVWAWRAQRDANLGQLRLATSSPGLWGEVLDGHGVPVGPPTAIPNEEPLSLPAGSYQVRIAASGVPSETWPVEIRAGEVARRSVGLPPRWLWTPRPIAHPAAVEIVRLGRRTGVLVLLGSERAASGALVPFRLRLLDGATAEPVWPADLRFDDSTLPAGGAAVEWRQLPEGTVAPGFVDTGLPERVSDLDADGTGDLLLVSRTSPSVVAVSGADGRVLWWHRGRPSLAPGSPGVTGWQAPGRNGTVVGSPVVVEIDGDGIPDVVGCFRSNGEVGSTAGGAVLRVDGSSWLAAVSGRTGQSLWQQSVAEDWAQYTTTSTVRDRAEPLTRPWVGEVAGRLVVVLVEGGRLRAWDARTGAPAWGPLEIGFPLDRMPRMVDLDGDRQPEAEIVHRGEEKDLAFAIAVVELPDGRVRWRQPTVTLPEHLHGEIAALAEDWHQLEDLDGDGRPEWVTLVGRRRPAGGWSFGIEVLEGATGARRWWQSLYEGDHPPSTPSGTRMVVGPDLDGDGRRELIALLPEYDRGTRRFGVRAVALSGKDGSPRWSRHHPGIGGIRSLDWWQADTDGTPMLVAATLPFENSRESAVVLGVGTGRMVHVLTDVRDVRIADLDDDGAPDLLYPVRGADALRWMTVRGSPGATWRRWGEWRPGPDGDGDGWTDFYGRAGESLEARSGRDGRRLWAAAADFSVPSAIYAPDPGAAGTANEREALVLAEVNVAVEGGEGSRAFRRSLTAFSAKDGSRRWTAADLDLGGGTRSGSTLGWMYDYPRVDLVDLDQDGWPEGLAATVVEGGVEWDSVAVGRDGVRLRGSPSPGGVRLTVVGGRDGATWWQVPVVDGALVLDPRPAGRPLADFNRDGILDFAMILPPGAGGGDGPAHHVQVLDGRTGRPGWPAAFALTRDASQLVWPEPSLGDLDGDGIPEVAVLRHHGFGEGQGGYRVELVILDGGSGQVRWTWSWVTGFPDVWPPLILSRPTGGLVAVGLWTTEFTGVVFLNARGTVLERRRLKLDHDELRQGCLVWRGTDVDGDGVSELVYLDDRQICVAGGPGLEVRARWSVGSPVDWVRVLDPGPSPAGETAGLAVWAGAEVFGLDGVTGAPRWRGTAPGPAVWGAPGAERVEWIRCGNDQRRPAIQYPAAIAGSEATVAWATWATDAKGRFRGVARDSGARAPGEGPR